MFRVLLGIGLTLALTMAQAQEGKPPNFKDAVNGPGSTLSQTPRAKVANSPKMPYGLQLLARPDLLPLLRDSRCVMDASYDHSGGNGDLGRFLRKEGNKAVLADMRGPGCVYRIWSANATGRLQIFFDGENQPRIDCPMQDFFLGKVKPFETPFVSKKSGGWYSYFPLPFAKSCRIEVTDPGSMYYHVQYQLFPDGTPVKSFTTELTPEDQTAIQTIRAQWGRLGADLVLSGENRVEVSGRTSCQPGQTKTLESLEGAGVLTLFRLRIAPADRFTLRQTLIRMTWDNAKTPAIEVPVGDFFGVGFGNQQFTSLPLSMINGTYSCVWPMPFRKGAKIEIVNNGKTPLTEITWKVAHQRLDKPVPEAAYFHAQWRRQTTVAGMPVALLHAKGRGHFVGAHTDMQGDHGLWFLEGDEQIYVDGETFPSIHGTGTEDYYTGGWYFDEGPFSLPFHGCVVKRDDYSRISAYRYQVTDCVPFQKEIVVNIEHGGTNDYPGADYCSTAYWYQDTPEHENPTVNVALLTPAVYKVGGVLEAETLTWNGGKVEVRDDSTLVSEASGGKLALLSGDKPTASLDVKEEDVYNLRIVQQAAAETTYKVRVAIDGKDEGGLFDFDQINVGDLKPGGRWEATIPIRLTPGAHTLALTPDEGKMVTLDYIKLDPSRKEKGVVEAESLHEKAVASNGKIVRLDSGGDWSGNSGLLWYPEQENATLALPFTVAEEGDYALELGVTRDNNAPIIAAKLDDATELETMDLFQTDPVTNVRRIRFGRIPNLKAGPHTLTLTYKGKASEVKSPTLQLDFFHLRKSRYPNTIEGESLKILGSKDGNATRQDMAGFGKDWSGDDQFWFLGSKAGSEATLELPIQKAGKYDLSVYYTTARDYGIVQVLIDDQPVGPPTDCFTPDVKAKGKTSLGTVELTAGNHKITFRSVDKNPMSSNYLIGVDAIGLDPVP
jgi:hypothetical protein